MRQANVSHDGREWALRQVQEGPSDLTGVLKLAGVGRGWVDGGWGGGGGGRAWHAMQTGIDMPHQSCTVRNACGTLWSL
jgi:hypothetical protein